MLNQKYDNIFNSLHAGFNVNWKLSGNNSKRQEVSEGMVE